MSEEKKKIVRLVFIGRYFSGKKMRHVYRLFEHKHDPHHDLLYSRPMGSSKRGKDIIGGIYEGEMSIDEESKTVFNTGNWKYKGLLEDQSQLASWHALDLAAVEDQRVYKLIQKDKEINPMFEVLEPIRKSMRKTNSFGRRAILAGVIEYLTR